MVAFQVHIGHVLRDALKGSLGTNVDPLVRTSAPVRCVRCSACQGATVPRERWWIKRTPSAVCPRTRYAGRNPTGLDRTRMRKDMIIDFVEN